jgi:hypothetical protein
MTLTGQSLSLLAASLTATASATARALSCALSWLYPRWVG